MFSIIHVLRCLPLRMDCCLCFPLASHCSNRQLKKKKQAAKRKSVAAEDVEPDGVAKAQASTSGAGHATKAPPIGQDDGALGAGFTGKDADTGGGADVSRGLVIDEEMPDASRPAALPVAVTGSETLVEAVTDTETLGGLSESAAGDTPPTPPEAAASNGKVTSVGSKQHKKSVSFVMAGGDVNALLGIKAVSASAIEGRVLPPVPPSPPGVSGAETGGKGDEMGSNDCFLHRNFRIGDNSEQVRPCERRKPFS